MLGTLKYMLPNQSHHNMQNTAGKASAPSIHTDRHCTSIVEGRADLCIGRHKLQTYFPTGKKKKKKVYTNLCQNSNYWDDWEVHCSPTMAPKLALVDRERGLATNPGKRWTPWLPTSDPCISQEVPAGSQFPRLTCLSNSQIIKRS